MKKNPLVVLLVLPLFFFFSLEEEEPHGTPVLDYVGKVINFLILFGGLGYLLRKPLRRFLEQREQDIDSTMKEAERERQEAEERSGQALDRLQRLEKEIEEIRKDAEEEGRRRKEKVVQAAEKEAERIKHFTNQEISMYYSAKVTELKATAAEQATALAKKNLEKRMTPEKQDYLIDLSIAKLEDLYER
ncbi:MAG: ATP synthase F0 subunit B [Candidatus Aminicenantes bacterium]|jgi:F-type H+-transporting ATPase subunit b